MSRAQPGELPVLCFGYQDILLVLSVVLVVPVLAAGTAEEACARTQGVCGRSQRGSVGRLQAPTTMLVRAEKILGESSR